MPENAQEKNIAEEKDKKDEEISSVCEEEKPRSYYYDDACGYEIYDADKDDEEDF